MGLEFAIEESVEDAFVAYLKSKLPGEIKVLPAWTDEKLQYPAVVVHAGMSANHNDNGIFDWRRKIQVNIGIQVQAVAEKNGGGITVRLARESNRAFRAAVSEQVGKAKLQDDLNAVNIPGVLFSMAYMMGVTRSVRGQDRVFESEIVLEVEAQPKAI